MIGGDRLDDAGKGLDLLQEQRSATSKGDVRTTTGYPLCSLVGLT